MKRMFSLVIALLSLTTFAEVERPTSSHESKTMCLSVEKTFQDEVADASVIHDQCVQVKMTIKATISGPVIAAMVPVRTSRGNSQTLCKGILKDGKMKSRDVRCANIPL